MTYKLGLIADLQDVDGDKTQNLADVYTAFEAAGCTEAFALGDMIDWWLAGRVATMESQFIIPTHWIVGNHDEYEDNFVTDLSAYQTLATSKGDFRRDYGNWTFLCINTINGYPSMTCEAETVAWFEQQLSTCVGRYVIVVSHAPFSANPEANQIGLLFPTNYSELLVAVDIAKANGVFVPLCLCGHGHSTSYSFPQYTCIDGTIHFMIDTCMDGVNAGILDLFNDGSWQITGIGDQKPLVGTHDATKTYILDQVNGADIGEPTAPKRSLSVFSSTLDTSLLVGENVILPSSIDWTFGSGFAIHTAESSYVAIGDVSFSGSNSKVAGKHLVSVEGRS